MAPDVGGMPLGMSMFCLAIDPADTTPYAEFIARIDRLTNVVHALPPISGVDRVRVPRAHGYVLAAVYEREGIPVSS